MSVVNWGLSKGRKEEAAGTEQGRSRRRDRGTMTPWQCAATLKQAYESPLREWVLMGEMRRRRTWVVINRKATRSHSVLPSGGGVPQFPFSEEESELEASH